MEKVKFTNEIDNPITIKIKHKRGHAINHKTNNKVRFNGVCIQMIGPHSMSENNITYKEAVQLHKALSRFLNKN